MAVIEGVCRIVGGRRYSQAIFTSQRSPTNRDRIIGTRSFATTFGKAIAKCWPGCAPSRAATHRNRVDRQLWCRAPALHATSKGHGPRGHDSGQGRSASAWQERRSRRAERRPCRLCRPADRDAAKPGRHDQILRILKACWKTAVSARRIALQMIHNTIVCAPDGLTRSTAQPHPHAASSVRWPRGDSILPLIATWILAIRIGLSNPSPAVTSSCMTRSQISTR